MRMPFNLRTVRLTPMAFDGSHFRVFLRLGVISVIFDLNARVALSHFHPL